FENSLLVTGGVSHDLDKTAYFSSVICKNGTGSGEEDCGGQLVGCIVTTNDLTSKETLFNWKLGTGYKPTNVLTLYANYAVSHQPPGRSNFELSSAANSANNPNLDPQKAKTIEAGAKWSALDEKLGVNLAVFQTTVSNEINSQVLDDDGNPTQTGRKRGKGGENTMGGTH